MARGKFYTEEEDKRIMAVCDDNPGMPNADLAEKVKKYGICANRDVNALARHIARILQPKTEDEIITEEDMQKDTDVQLLIVEKERDELKRKYEAVCSAVIGSAELFDNNNNALKLNFRSIIAWMYKEEPERANARIEELQLLREDADKQKTSTRKSKKH